MKQDIVIIGAGGFGREVAAMVTRTTLNEEFNLLGFLDDGVKETTVNNIQVLGGTGWLKDRPGVVGCVIAVGNPGTRQAVVEKIKGMDRVSFPNVIHPRARLHDTPFIEIGAGNIICDGTILTTNIKLGNFNIINLSCTIGHDCTMGNYCSVMPGVNVSGGAQLGDRVYIGTGAKLIKATALGNDCVVGAGSVVNSDIPPGKTFVGIPAREIHS